jgi:hypothetical protein
MNMEHKSNFEAMHETLVDYAFKQNRQVETDRNYKLNNYNTLYSNESFNLTDGRTLNIRMVRIPTFSYQNKPMYYTVFFCSTDWWSIGNIPSISNACKKMLRKQDGDSHSIFLCGLQKGFINKKDTYLLKKFNTMVINSRKRHVDEVRANVFKAISGFLRVRCIELYKRINSKTYDSENNNGVVAGAWRVPSNGRKQCHIYGQLKKDWQRLNDFVVGLWVLVKRFWKIRMRKRRNLKKEIGIKKESLSISNNSSINKEKKKKKKKFVSKWDRINSIYSKKVAKVV